MAGIIGQKEQLKGLTGRLDTLSDKIAGITGDPGVKANLRAQYEGLKRQRPILEAQISELKNAKTDNK